MKSKNKALITLVTFLFIAMISSSSLVEGYDNLFLGATWGMFVGVLWFEETAKLVYELMDRTFHKEQDINFDWARVQALIENGSETGGER